jgi:hypothetical protein
MHFPHPDITADPHAQLHRELGKARRTIKYIRNCIPAETFRPKNEHTHTTILQRIYNELIRYEREN